MRFHVLVILGLCTMLACKQRQPQTTRASASDTSAPSGAPAPAPATPVAQIDTATAQPAAEPDHPLLEAVRRREGSNLTQASIADERPVNFHGQHHIVVIRRVMMSRYINFSVHVTDSTMTSTVRAVAFLQAPWPDYKLRIERVTADSVYLTGTSAAYRRTLSRVFPWVPLNVGPRPLTTERPPSALTAPACSGATVQVDLDARTIAGIWMNQSVDNLKREVGAANMTTDTGYAEGQPQEEYVIMLCGHEIKRRWNGVSWTDPAFRTAEGLGVGSPLAAFDTLHGTGEAIGEEGNSVRYTPLEGIGHFFVDVSPGCYRIVNQRWDVDRSCRATGVAFIVFPR